MLNRLLRSRRNKIHKHFDNDIRDETKDKANSSEINSDHVPAPESLADIDALLGGSDAVDRVVVEEAVLPKSHMSEAITHKGTHTTLTSEPATGLLNNEESKHFRKQWDGIQSRFVDDPHAAIQQADSLTSEVIEKITGMFASELNSLQNQRHENNDVTTEDLRQALQRYRAYINSLVG
jgi:hypothetical protein